MLAVTRAHTLFVDDSIADYGSSVFSSYPNPTPSARCPQRQRPYHRHYRRAGGEICDRFRAQSERFGTSIITETVDTIETGSTPFLIHTSTTTVAADAVVIATGAVARRLEFPGSIEFWCARVLSLVLDTRKPPLPRSSSLFFFILRPPVHTPRAPYTRAGRKASARARCAMVQHPSSRGSRWLLSVAGTQQWKRHASSPNMPPGFTWCTGIVGGTHSHLARAHVPRCPALLHSLSLSRLSGGTATVLPLFPCWHRALLTPCSCRHRRRLLATGGTSSGRLRSCSNVRWTILS